MLAVSSVALTSCDEDLAVPPMSVPQAPEGMKATMTIAEFKNKYWSSDNNYCTQVGQTDKDEDVILAGRIIASDEGGNIYQNVMLQDETGAVTIAVLTSANDGLKNLYTKYKVGEEMFINATGLYAGKYAGLFQIGTAGEYNGTPQTSKMAATEFLSHTYLNGLPDPSAITEITMTIPEILAATDEAAQKKYQSQLVRTRVASNLSPWLSQCEVGDIHTVAISHGEGRFVAPPALLDSLVAAGQVATQYVDEAGVPSMDLSVNPNGSLLAIEGITSPDGRVFGKMGHSERSGEGLYKNVGGNLYQPIIEGGVAYFG